MLTLATIILFLGVVGTLLRLNQALRLHRLAPTFQGRYPFVSIIRPVKGLDVGAAENFRAGLNTGYPGEVETIFVFDSNDDPAYKVANEIANEFQGRVRIITSGAPPPGRTGKLHAMIAGEKEAKGELIAFTDSDTRPDKNVLRVLVETLLTTQGAGSVFVPVVSDQPLQKVGDVFYALLQNALYAPWALLAAGKPRSLPFIMGQYMVFTRQCLEKIGGVQCATGQLVDDMFIGKKVHEAGLRNVIAPYSLSIFSSGLSFAQFIPIYRKWFQFGKNGLPFSFVWRQWAFAACFFIALALAVLAFLLSNPVATILASITVVAFCYGLAQIHRAYGGSPVPLRYFWAPFVMMIVALAVVISNRLSNKVVWRGRVYKVDQRAALNPDRV